VTESIDINLGTNISPFPHFQIEQQNQCKFQLKFKNVIPVFQPYCFLTFDPKKKKILRTHEKITFFVEAGNNPTPLIFNFWGDLNFCNFVLLHLHEKEKSKDFLWGDRGQGTGVASRTGMVSARGHN
jgi:hypothetical protein